jgi:hypothetical protein
MKGFLQEETENTEDWISETSVFSAASPGTPKPKNEGCC